VAASDELTRRRRREKLVGGSGGGSVGDETTVAAARGLPVYVALVQGLHGAALRPDGEGRVG